MSFDIKTTSKSNTRSFRRQKGNEKDSIKY